MGCLARRSSPNVIHVVLALLAGCATSDGDYVITVGFEPPELAASAERVELAIMDRCADVPLGSMPSGPLAQTTRERGRGAGAPWGANVAPGERALYGRALTASGTPFAAGCRAVRLAAGAGGQIRLVLRCLPASGVCTCRVECNGACVDTASDVENCGSCGIVCAPGEECTGGSCRAGLDGGPGTDAAPGVDAGPPRMPGDVVAFATSKYNSCAVRADGSLWCWGGGQRVGVAGAPTANPRPLMVEGAGWSDVAIGLNHSCGRQGGAGFCWGNPPGEAGSAVPVHVTAPDTWIQIAVNEYDFSCGVDSAHALWCWGRNAEGELGLGDMVDRPTPTRVGTETWRQVSTGHLHTCGVRDDGELFCWGLNTDGAVGIGTVTQSLIPANVGLRGVDEVSAGNSGTCAISGAELFCWGGLGYTVPSSLTPTGVAGSWSHISRAHDHACAVRPDGTLWCWGAGSSGQLGLGPGRDDQAVPQQVEGTDWTQVSAGYDTTCAVRTDRSLWCWGDNEYGHLGVGDGDARDVPTRVVF